MKLSNPRHVLPELSALTGPAEIETFDVLDGTVEDVVFTVDSVVREVVEAEDEVYVTDDVMDVELELAFVVVE